MDCMTACQSHHSQAASACALPSSCCHASCLTVRPASCYSISDVALAIGGDDRGAKQLPGPDASCTFRAFVHRGLPVWLVVHGASLSLRSGQGRRSCGV
jgi:hypothetical protein